MKLQYSNNAIFFKDAFPDIMREYALTFLDVHDPITAEIMDNTEVSGGKTNLELRQTEVRFIHCKESTEPLFNWITDFANEYRWYFSGKTGMTPNLTNKVMRRLSPEPIQIATYKEMYYYQWHQDGLADGGRRLTLITPLTSSKDYEGGELQFKDEDVPTWALDIGSIILHRPELWHRVIPVTKGVRNSLVTWFE
jgi:hypothetical protein